MKYRYDLHIHSGLSPCGDKDMTPINIVAAASAVGLDIIALTDHNSIGNVKNVIKYGEMLNILVVPGVELTTNEDVHVLCYFDTFEKLEKFFSEITYPFVKNNPCIFGRQYIYNENDEIESEVQRLLITGSDFSENIIYELAKKHGGIAVPAHIDRQGSGMLLTLGTVPSYYPTIEISRAKKISDYPKYAKAHNVIRNSDAHDLNLIGIMRGKMELPSLNATEVIKKLSEYKSK